MKENDGRGARRKWGRRVALWGGGACGACLGLYLVVIVVAKLLSTDGLLLDATADLRRQLKNSAKARLRNSNVVDSRMMDEAQEFRQDLRAQFHSKDEVDILEMALNAEIHLVDLHVVEEELLRSPSNTYAGVYGSFCALKWSIHKKDPSSAPMFRDLVNNSPDCEKHKWKLDIHKLATLARHQDEEKKSTVVKPLNLTAVVFHESRCGSTLVANALAAMDPAKHRAYSESTPPASAFKSVCGENFSRCSMDQAAMVLKDVLYIMGRSNDPKEERVFFKFQSVTSKFIEVFQKAYPQVPWMYIYRDPVQVMMSHVKDDPTLSRANCMRTYHRPPPDLIHLVHRHRGKHQDISKIPKEHYCAAHLATLTESAVRALDRNHMGIPINYENLPGALWETVLPKIWGRDLTDEEEENISSISTQYSKGRGNRKGTFVDDSKAKEHAANDRIREAAMEYLQESFQLLSDYEPSLLQ